MPRVNPRAVILRTRVFEPPSGVTSTSRTVANGVAVAVSAGLVTSVATSEKRRCREGSITGAGPRAEIEPAGSAGTGGVVTWAPSSVSVTAPFGVKPAPVSVTVSFSW